MFEVSGFRTSGGPLAKRRPEKSENPQCNSIIYPRASCQLFFPKKRFFFLNRGGYVEPARKSDAFPLLFSSQIHVENLRKPSDCVIMKSTYPPALPAGFLNIFCFSHVSRHCFPPVLVRRIWRNVFFQRQNPDLFTFLNIFMWKTHPFPPFSSPFHQPPGGISTCSHFPTC